MAGEKDLIKWLGLLGIFLAIVAPFASMGGMKLDWAVWLIALLGLVAGIFLKADVKTMLAGIVLLSISGIFASIPAFGSLLNDIFKNIAVFAGALIAIPALKIIWSKFKVKL
jgi:hypothetical protein